MSEPYHFNKHVEQYNQLLSKLIIQARNDFNQFYEVKENDQTETAKLVNLKPILSSLSTKIVSELNNLTTTLYNKIYYGMLESECTCGNPHDHNGYSKVSAKINNVFLEINLHYLLEPFTRTKLKWEILNKLDGGNVPKYIMIRVCLVK